MHSPLFAGSLIAHFHYTFDYLYENQYNTRRTRETQKFRAGAAAVRWTAFLKHQEMQISYTGKEKRPEKAEALVLGGCFCPFKAFDVVDIDSLFLCELHRLSAAVGILHAAHVDARLQARNADAACVGIGNHATAKVGHAHRLGVGCAERVAVDEEHARAPHPSA